jgi:hypothetical protein
MTAVHPDDKDWNSPEDVAAYDEPHTGQPYADLGVPSTRGTAEALIGKIPLWGKIQNILYSVALIQWATGIVTAVYVIIIDWTWFGYSFHNTWNNLNTLWHVRAIPWIGTFLYENWALARHLYYRNLQETVLSYAFVSMIIVAISVKPKLRGRVPWTHKLLVKMGMPSPYQSQLGRHPDTSGLQYLFLLPSMIICELPGIIVFSAVVFGGMAIGHRLGYDPAWFRPEGTIGIGTVQIPWVTIVVGLGAGHFYGRLPAVKAGQDIQRRYLDVRLAMRYRAGEILNQAIKGTVDEDAALNALTALPRTRPPELYPATYRHWYDALLKAHAPARPRSKWATAASRLTVTLCVLLGIYGIYIQRYGIHAGHFWEL